MGEEAATSLDISLESLRRAVLVYRTKIHLQPLPLFDLNGLAEYLAKAPSYLRWSFISLCWSFESTGHDLDSYAKASRQTVMELACEGTATFDIIKSLCLLAMRDMAAGDERRAWMTIGTATRLQAFHGGIHADEEEHSRCYWSLFLLERASCSHPWGLKDITSSPQHPASPSWPSPTPLNDNSDGVICLPAVDEGVEDLGIISYCITLVSIWGDVNSYLQQVRSGRALKPWLSDSGYAQLSLSTFECDSKMALKHSLRNAYLQDRPPSDFVEYREYWTSWILMQLTLHAIPAILNHPFIHFIVTKDQNHNPQSRLFLKQATDQALFHSGWIAKLLSIVVNFQLDITNPLIGDLVAAVATVCWMFQFAQDTGVATQAKKDLEVCDQFLARLSSIWPHIAQKQKLLRELEVKVENSRSEGTGEVATITFKATILWSILHSSIAPFSTTSREEEASVCLNIHSIPPLTEEHGVMNNVAHSELLPRDQSWGFDLFDEDFFQFTHNID
ncbi:hypothetical protein K461DRAFT_275486 [Myriangium duriaei CBS 260.36]|uniref:Transcription factor domain-containing protein n=1 Tax=Myriangium duriaei CBS 260.36 TaxID=1168546 RepID=A0A9P4MIV1_9PEZI|nr:hypothetical protein K461DRAFT_275486 [Myriangium duriaei CBS 260.36]